MASIFYKNDLMASNVGKMYEITRNIQFGIYQEIIMIETSIKSWHVRFTNVRLISCLGGKYNMSH